MRPPAQLKAGTLTLTTPTVATSEIKSITSDSTSNNGNFFLLTENEIFVCLLFFVFCSLYFLF